MGEDSGSSEDHGEWLDFRMRDGRARTAAKISRKAMEDHFGAKDDGHSLLSIYVTNSEVIHQKVRAKMKMGGPYTPENPVELRSLDFLASSGASLSIHRVPGRMTDDEIQRFLAQVARPNRQGDSSSGNYVHWKAGIGRVGLTGIFSADQLEAMAAWMRRALKDEQ
ncbi:hypothetical protein [Variovorax sp. PAMC26660]|uniref:hypothetical protein n=1 Tax=Variovorax sp. PAMC26660 TaxID=2762322 RepID=UPI00164D11ED|nr:hypothetical protein [Variovorax sp. PAMC26660]QNK67674.1 hypothetical protein H7F35_31815 [Variovorax sp. PAMC26660]